MRLSSSLIAVAVATFGFLNGGEGTGGFLGGEGGGAYAADIGRGGMKDSGVDSAPAGERPVNFSGFYISVQGGYGNANHNLTVQSYNDTFADRCLTGVNVPDAATGPCAGNGQLQVGKTGSSVDFFNIDGINSSGFIGGGRLGYDRQIGRFVVGVFGEYNFTNMESTASALGVGAVALEKGDEWSLGGRAGIVLGDRTLAYILAAYTQTEYDVTGVTMAPKLVDQDRRNLGATFSGVTVGTGIEHALTQNVFVGLEYTHTFYGSETIADDYNAICNDGTRIKDDLDEDKVMGRITVKLNGGLF